ncbi:RNA-directed DNA methylation 4 isoform X2 [Tripterygium wilfordii]|uniref:RNA-directed DNA methylation 4 isoform X2 n=1 Tax=Tripterygium wilfordii TaxID=458696 RepID=UPI0018F82594|nr:RNA-directed DNA methylation 4 isoform X2 [Tripterygium wilfordii]
MANASGEGSSAPLTAPENKPLFVRVKRKAAQSCVDAFWLEISERPLKRPLLDFDKLSISDSHGKGLKKRKVFVQHVETVNTSETILDIVNSFVPDSSDASNGKSKTTEDQRRVLRKDNKQDELLFKARQKQEVLAKNARFEQIWRSRKGNKQTLYNKTLYDMCHFYDVVRVDVEERSNVVRESKEMSVEDQKMLSSYLPILREFIPSAVAEIESDVCSYLSEEDEYVYDYYTVKDGMDVDDEGGSNPFPLVQVDDEDFYDIPYESEFDSEDSNAEDNPRNDYPDEISEEDVGSGASDSESEHDSESASSKSSEQEDIVPEVEAEYYDCEVDSDESYDDEFGRSDDDDYYGTYNDHDDVYGERD